MDAPGKGQGLSSSHCQLSKGLVSPSRRKPQRLRHPPCRGWWGQLWSWHFPPMPQNKMYRSPALNELVGIFSVVSPSHKGWYKLREGTSWRRPVCVWRGARIKQEKGQEDGKWEERPRAERPESSAGLEPGTCM